MAAKAPGHRTVPWWSRPTLMPSAAGLVLAGHRVDALATHHGTPLYLYDGARIRTQIATVRAALARFRAARIYYAMKANRYAAVLDLVRQEGIGIDACSPAEVALASAAGFAGEQISFTASSLSSTDLLAVAKTGAQAAFDYVPAALGFSELTGHHGKIGLRVDAGQSAGYGARTNYGGGKLGLAPEDVVPAAAALAHEGAAVVTLHTHLGWGLRAADEAAFRRAMTLMAELAQQIPSVTTINVGGGLGARLREGDAPLPVDRWAAALWDAFGDRYAIACEPGTLLVADAGVLVARVTAVWNKRGERWVGLDAGQAVNVYAAHYGLELEIVPVADPLAPAVVATQVAGNINEAGDVFARNRMLPPLQEADLVALLPAGAYGSSMASNHCLRGSFAEVLL